MTHRLTDSPTHRLIFLGTPDFAVPSLNALAKDDCFDIVGVVTQPDRPVGRKGVITPPPVKVAAQKLGMTTIKQPEKLTDPDFKAWIEEIGPTCDAFIVVAYGKIFRDWFIALPKQGLINVHASLLPRWRGASPINAAIAAGDEKSGVCIMKITEGMDEGPVYTCAETPITSNDTGESLHDRLAQLGADLLPDTLLKILEHQIEAKPQDSSNATYCKTLNRDDGKLDFSKPAAELERLIRAYTPWPGGWMIHNGKRLKILKASIQESTDHSPQTLKLLIPCGDGNSLSLDLVQPEGGKVMTGAEYARGIR
ncbi:MAG: methionyl-tRNA formyltransferase [Patescibacteria group bacterium]